LRNPSGQSLLRVNPSKAAFSVTTEASWGELGELRGKQKTGWVTKRILRRPYIDIGKGRDSLDIAALVHHIHVLLAYGLSFDASKVNHLGLGGYL
jgi:hypothetical protein